jgi:hypothetical protein
MSSTNLLTTIRLLLHLRPFLPAIRMCGAGHVLWLLDPATVSYLRRVMITLANPFRDRTTLVPNLLRAARRCTVED